MSTAIIQAGGDVNLVQELRDQLLLGSTKFKNLTKPNYLKWVHETDFIDKYETFHGPAAQKEMLSAIKSLRKGDESSLPLSFNTLKGFKLPKLSLWYLLKISFCFVLSSALINLLFLVA